MLVRLARGGEYPPHAHAGVEELYLLHGELWIDERRLFPGDYRPPPGRPAGQPGWGGDRRALGAPSRHGGSAGMERDRLHLRPHHEHRGRAVVVVFVTPIPGG